MKRFLLDTHVLLWWLSGDSVLGPETKKAIIDSQNDIFVSAATTWEISIKKAIGKLDAPDDMDQTVEQERFIKLPISLYHGQMAGLLHPIHKDPFDRMLISQAKAEGLTIITADKVFAEYDVKILAANS